MKTKKFFTISLPPTEIIPDIGFWRITHSPPIKAWRILQYFFSKKLAPIHHIRRGKKGANTRYNLAASPFFLWFSCKILTGPPIWKAKWHSRHIFNELCCTILHARVPRHCSCLWAKWWIQVFFLLSFSFFFLLLSFFLSFFFFFLSFIFLIFFLLCPSFLLKRTSNLYGRRSSKIVTGICSPFTSSYVMNWSKFFCWKGTAISSKLWWEGCVLSFRNQCQGLFQLEASWL